MAGIVFRNKNNEIKSLTGPEYTNATPKNKTLFVQTGTATSNRLKYGLTTDTTASIYSPVIMIDGKKHYIGRTSTASTTTTSATTASTTTTSATTKQQSNTTTYNHAYKSYLTTTSSRMQYANSYAMDAQGIHETYTKYAFRVTSKFLDGTYVSKSDIQLTLTSTLYRKCDSQDGIVYVIFNTSQGTEKICTANNGLEYRFISSQTETLELPTNYESRWQWYPGNNTNCSYDGNYSTTSLVTGSRLVKGFDITQTNRVWRDPWKIMPLIRTYYTKIPVNNTLASIIDNSLYGGVQTHTSTLHYSFVDNTYTTSSADLVADGYSMYTYIFTDNYSGTIGSSTTSFGHVNDTSIPADNIQSSLSKLFTFRGYGLATFSDYSYVMNSTYTLSRNYTWKNTSSSITSGLTGATTSKVTTSIEGGLFTKVTATKSMRNHPRYQVNKNAGSRTLSKGSPYMQTETTAFGIFEISESVSVTFESTRLTRDLWAFHTAKVTTSVSNISETRTSTSYYTDTVTNTVSTKTVSTKTVSTNTYTNNCNA